MSRLLGYDADGMPLAVDDPEHDAIVEETMREPEIAVGTRVWIRHIAVRSNNPRFPVLLVKTDDPTLPDHPALKPTALELDERRRRGEEAMAVVLPAMCWTDVILSIDNQGHANVEQGYPYGERPKFIIDDIRRQLDAQRGEGA